MKARFALPFCFFLGACGGYHHEGDRITFETCNEGNGCTTIVVQGADAASFETLDHGYARDKRSAYFDGQPVPGALGASFRSLSETYAKDAAHAYYRLAQIAAADVASFEAEDNLNYARDKTDIYFQGAPMHVCDLASFRWLSDQWEVDDRCAYRNDKKLPDAHAKSFVALNFWYAKDDTQVYSSVAPVVEGADAATFELANAPCEVCARDRNRCYNAGAVTPCSTFAH